ncbi:MAG TPA: DUF5698 domain-containing protein [Deltaproteobacteria bacterium]|nr:DUF5698 domain-containing protein [Deltaproteobacteria bacterium]
MGLSSLGDMNLYAWVILPAMIFLARILDVSLGTIRIIFIARNLRYIAPFIGFVEVMIWLLAVRQIMQGDKLNLACFIGYSAGFAFGTFVGMCLENLLSIGKVVIRVITKADSGELESSLRAAGFGLTSTDARGATGPVKLVFSIVERHDIHRIVSLIERFDPKAFYTIEDVRFVSECVTPFRIRETRVPRWLWPLRPGRRPVFQPVQKREAV